MCPCPIGDHLVKHAAKNAERNELKTLNLEDEIKTLMMEMQLDETEMKVKKMKLKLKKIIDDCEQKKKVTEKEIGVGIGISGLVVTLPILNYDALFPI